MNFNYSGSGKAGGLFAEAGTPFGQAARAGLGGNVDSEGHASGKVLVRVFIYSLTIT